jgi:VanZ family protein
MVPVMAEATAPPLDRAVRPARWLLLGLSVAVLLILFWPIRPAGGDQDGLALWLTQQHARGQLRWLTFGLIEFGSNMVMFAPLGALAALSRPRGGDAVALAACFGLSAFAELVQWLVLPNRTGDLRDVLANTLGAAIGIGVVALIRRRRPTG